MCCPLVLLNLYNDDYRTVVASWLLLICSFVQFRRHELGFMSLACILLEEVGEEKDFEDGEHDEELYADNQPQRPPEGHRAEAIVVETEYAA